MFIHWGPVSLKGTEISWSRANSNPAHPNKGPIPVEVYDNLYKQFNPTKFDARRVGRHRPGRGHEIHGADGQALRRLLPLGLEGQRLQRS